jgi:cell wall-associated NlpC family hydrolase
VIVAVAEDMASGSPLVGRMSLMAAYTESRLVDLGPEAGSDSLGLYQQRASQGWGTPAQEEDPTSATAMFVSALLGLPDWEAMAPWTAVQGVQRSRFLDGSNYQANWDLAGQIVTRAETLGVEADCGEVIDATTAGPAARFGLPTGYTIPATVDPAEVEALRYALAQLGRAYVWGAAGPQAFDCSGLTMMAWAATGVRLLHNTLDQMAEGTPVVDLANISPGDLVLIPGSDGTLAAPGHVGIYLGFGLVESAVDPAQGVIVQNWANFTAGGLSAVRHIA